MSESSEEKSFEELMENAGDLPPEPGTIGDPDLGIELDDDYEAPEDDGTEEPCEINDEEEEEDDE